MAITPELVPAGQLVGASALNQTSTQLARVLIGPAVGRVASVNYVLSPAPPVR
jgi:hypothetical protein